jgi:hypothetical protein
MDERPDPEPTVNTLLAHLRFGGARDLRALGVPAWIVGRAPSGIEFELHYWAGRGYTVTVRPRPGGRLQLLGAFDSWAAAVDQALRA